jgi:hypothetical protein
MQASTSSCALITHRDVPPLGAFAHAMLRDDLHTASTPQSRAALIHQDQHCMRGAPAQHTFLRATMRAQSSMGQWHTHKRRQQHLDVSSVDHMLAFSRSHACILKTVRAFGHTHKDTGKRTSWHSSMSLFSSNTSDFSPPSCSTSHTCSTSSFRRVGQARRHTKRGAFICKIFQVRLSKNT